MPRKHVAPVPARRRLVQIIMQPIVATEDAAGRLIALQSLPTVPVCEADFKATFQRRFLTALLAPPTEPPT